MKLTFCFLYSLSIFSYFLPWWRLPASSFRRCYTFSSTFYVNILLMSTFSLLYHSSNASCAVRTCSPNAKLFFIFLSVGLNIHAHHLTAVNNSLCPLPLLTGINPPIHHDHHNISFVHTLLSHTSTPVFVRVSTLICLQFSMITL